MSEYRETCGSQTCETCHPPSAPGIRDADLEARDKVLCEALARVLEADPSVERAPMPDVRGRVCAARLFGCDAYREKALQPRR